MTPNPKTTFYKDFQPCDGCLTCVGPECSLEKTLYTVGEYKLCGACTTLMHERGSIDPDTGRKTGFKIRLFPDGSTKQVPRYSLPKQGLFQKVKRED